MAKHVLIVDAIAATRTVRVRGMHHDGALLADLHRAHDGLGASPGNAGARFDLILRDVNLPTLGAATPATVARGARRR
jgi:hypothetical protein